MGNGHSLVEISLLIIAGGLSELWTQVIPALDHDLLPFLLQVPELMDIPGYAGYGHL